MSSDVNSTSFTVKMAISVSLICSFLLAGLYVVTKKDQERNFKIDNQRSVLIAANLATPSTPSDEVESWFGENGKIEGIIINYDGTLSDTQNITEYLKNIDKLRSEKLLVYKCNEEDQEAYIFPVFGVGLWGPLKGYLALGKDGDTILGISFYNHKETPGLGAEIDTPWFRNQFKGKKLFRDGKFEGIEVIKGIVEERISDESIKPYKVDGISGATITANGVTAIMKEYVKKYLVYLKNEKKS